MTDPPPMTGDQVAERPASDGSEWLLSDVREFDREHPVNLARLLAFIAAMLCRS